MSANEMPERIWLDVESYNGAVGFAHPGPHKKDGWPGYLRFDLIPDLCASGQVRALTRAAGDERKAGWIISFDDLQAIRAAAGDWGYGIDLEAVEAIALDVERRILAALTPAPQPDAEHCGCGDKACLACFPAATPAAQEAVPVAWGESYDGGAFFNTVSLTKTKHHTYPLYAHPPQPSETVAVAVDDLVRAMRLFWEADEAADECRATGKDLEAARYDKMATGRWQSIPEKIDALDAALRALKGGEANG